MQNSMKIFKIKCSISKYKYQDYEINNNNIRVFNHFLNLCNQLKKKKF